MDIISTKAVEVSIHAVSPELILSTPVKKGSVGPSAHAHCTDNVKAPKKVHRDNLFVKENPPVSLNGTGVPFAGADAYDLLEIEDENLSVADLAGLRRFGDSLDHLLEQRIVDRDFYFCLGHEFHDVFGAPINLRMTALPAETADLGHRDALHAYFADGLPDIVELEWFDDRGDELHRLCSSPIRMLTVVRKHRLCHLQRIERDQRLSILRAGNRIVSALNRGMDEESMPCNEASPAVLRTARHRFTSMTSPSGPCRLGSLPCR